MINKSHSNTPTNKWKIHPLSFKGSFGSWNIFVDGGFLYNTKIHFFANQNCFSASKKVFNRKISVHFSPSSYPQKLGNNFSTLSHKRDFHLYINYASVLNQKHNITLYYRDDKPFLFYFLLLISLLGTSFFFRPTHPLSTLGTRSWDLCICCPE